MANAKPFCLEEATIDELHEAIRNGETTCVAVVQHYIERARAYNGVASRLVTEDGGPAREATGMVRATAPLRFPTETVKASAILPDLDNYTGPPIEFGRMETTASDPAVQGASFPARRPGRHHARGPRRARIAGSRASPPGGPVLLSCRVHGAG